MEEWGIGEFEEMLEVFTSKDEDMEQLQASSEAEITDLSILDTESMDISMVEPIKPMAQIQEHAKLAKKGIKEVVALTVKGRFQVQSSRGPETQEPSKLYEKWTRLEQSLEKASSPSIGITED